MSTRGSAQGEGDRLGDTGSLNRTSTGVIATEGVKAGTVALVTGGLYLVVTEIVICLQTGWSHLVPLAPADTISLFTGAVTAAALSAVYIQVRESRIGAEQRSVEGCAAR